MEALFSDSMTRQFFSDLQDDLIKISIHLKEKKQERGVGGDLQSAFKPLLDLSLASVVIKG